MRVHVITNARTGEISQVPYTPEEEAAADRQSVPERVSARRFRMQLRLSGVLDEVKAWVASQDPIVQDAFEYSSEFVRSEPMMQAGFAALGFSSERIDAFFMAAARL
jgi:hypothetical protein